ncbi:hypothetical protein GOP47_0002485 [Adiantum capillus-veneris]|uniref:Uncharacterized protein n=1 Tax=Adiantum capillus-veneris TaxID=13818 RepID=A0A9D4VAR8_ADICA|nr:hypothetical protein GOP47_0002485 [Adiantum capillus-veneris]
MLPDTPFDDNDAEGISDTRMWKWGAIDVDYATDEEEATNEDDSSTDEEEESSTSEDSTLSKESVPSTFTHDD